MEKAESLSQQRPIYKTGSTAAKDNVDSAEIREDMKASDVHYHADKLNLGGHGAHEGWIKAEEVGQAAASAVSTDAYREMVAVAAYYIAEKRGFAGHEMLADWTRAEAEVAAMRH